MEGKYKKKHLIVMAALVTVIAIIVPVLHTFYETSAETNYKTDLLVQNERKRIVSPIFYTELSESWGINAPLEKAWDVKADYNYWFVDADDDTILAVPGTITKDFHVLRKITTPLPVLAPKNVEKIVFAEGLFVDGWQQNESGQYLWREPKIVSPDFTQNETLQLAEFLVGDKLLQRPPENIKFVESTPYPWSPRVYLTDEDELFYEPYYFYLSVGSDGLYYLFCGKEHCVCIPSPIQEKIQAAFETVEQ